MWTIDDLRKDLLELKRLLYEEKDLKKRVELCNYIERLELLICENTHSSKIKYDKEELFFNSLYNLPKYRIYMPYVRNFVNIIDPYFDDKQIKAPKSKLYTDRDMYDLTDSFFKGFDKETYDIYKRIDKEKDDKLAFIDMKSRESSTYIIPRLDKFYINLGVDDDAERTIEAYIHEIGHIITARKNQNRYHRKYLFTEIESLFYEILADEFLYKETGNELFNHLEEIKANYYYITSNVIDIHFYAYDHTANKLTKIKNSEKKYLKYLDEEGLIKKEHIDIDTLMMYLFSYICAIELVGIYKEDKVEAIKILNTITSDRLDISEYENIITNIEPNNHVKRYIKELKKVKD